MKKLWIGLLSSMLFNAPASTSTTPDFSGLTLQEKGLAISQEIHRRGQGFQDFTAEMTMILRNRKGQESTRKIRSMTLEVENDGDKSMSIFEEPADVKGTVSLTYSHGLQPDDQWLYLPAIKRVKRIHSKTKSGPFMGSEFAFEDISSQEVEKYTYKYLHDEKIDGKSCFVVERYPAYAYSGYTRQIIWVDQREFITLKVEYYDRKDTLLKTLLLKDYYQHLDHFWRAHEMHMENHQTGKSTTLNWSQFKFKTGLSERDFDQTALKRIQ